MREYSKIVSHHYLLRIFLNTIFHPICFFLRKIRLILAVQSGAVVIISLHKLGDSVFTIPAIKAIVSHHKKRIIILCYRDSTSIYKLALKNVEYYEINPNRFHFKNRIADRKSLSLINRLAPEIVYDLTGVMLSATFLFKSRAKVIVGTNRNQFKYLYDKFVSVRNTPHLIDIYLDIVSTNIKDLKVEYRSNISITSKPGKKIVIQPFAGWSEKEWGIYNYFKLIVNLQREFLTSILFPMGVCSVDLLQAFRDANIEILETRNIEDLIECLKECSLFIGNDSGPLHIASLVGVPTFCIFGPSNPDFHIPKLGLNGYVSQQLKCSPKQNEKLCYTNGGRSGCPSNECLKSLSVNIVYNQIIQFIYQNKLIIACSNQ